MCLLGQVIFYMWGSVAHLADPYHSCAHAHTWHTHAHTHAHTWRTHAHTYNGYRMKRMGSCTRMQCQPKACCGSCCPLLTAQGRPTGVVAAAKDAKLAREVQELFASPVMRVNTTTDVTGGAGSALLGRTGPRGHPGGCGRGGAHGA